MGEGCSWVERVEAGVGGWVGGWVGKAVFRRDALVIPGVSLEGSDSCFGKTAHLCGGNPSHTHAHTHTHIHTKKEKKKEEGL